MYLEFGQDNAMQRFLGERQTGDLTVKEAMLEEPAQHRLHNKKMGARTVMR